MSSTKLLDTEIWLVCKTVSDQSPLRTGTSCVTMRLSIAGVAQRGRGRSVGLSEEEGGEGETREETREEDREEGEDLTLS